MKKDLQNSQIAHFALSTTFDDVGQERIDQLKRHLLDSIGSLLFSTNQPTIRKLIRQFQALETTGNCKVPVLDGLPCDRAAQFYTALIRYPDFMDNYLGKEATCHPSDNIGSLLAATQLKGCSGKDFLTAMAIAYQIECRLVEEIPVMKKGIDHTLLLAYSVVAAVSKLMSLTEMQTAHALGIAGCSISPTVTTRASYTFEWKGMVSSMDALECINIVMLAQQGMTGPIASFEGPKGFTEIFDMKLDHDWSKEGFDLIDKCILKRYNAEVHSQSAIEAAIELREMHQIKAEDIKEIEVTTFLTAYHIIGGGEYGERKMVESKEQADHSIFYLIAVALIDGDIYPDQFLPHRIVKNDVQQLLQKIKVDTTFPVHSPVELAGVIDPYTRAYPGKMMAKVTVLMNNGEKFSLEKEDYYGFHTRPFDWEYTIEKFRRLTGKVINRDHQDKIIREVHDLENAPMDKLFELINIKPGRTSKVENVSTSASKQDSIKPQFPTRDSTDKKL